MRAMAVTVVITRGDAGEHQTKETYPEGYRYLISDGNLDVYDVEGQLLGTHGSGNWLTAFYDDKIVIETIKPAEDESSDDDFSFGDDDSDSSDDSDFSFGDDDSASSDDSDSTDADASDSSDDFSFGDDSDSTDSDSTESGESDSTDDFSFDFGDDDSESTDSTDSSESSEEDAEASAGATSD